MSSSLATAAQFYRIALEVGLCDPDDARAWAISVIDKLSAPPGEIIEVSWRKPLAHLIEDLNSVQGEADISAIRSWLLHELWRLSANSTAHVDRAVRQGMQLARSLSDEELYYQFDRIDDGLQLATTQVYGTVAEVQSDLEEVLKDGMSLPPHDVIPDFRDR